LNRIFVSDCEGPISKNDNAYELTAQFVPDGAKLFSVISKYDDVLADVEKKQGYNAGDTLKLILPFLKAYDVTDQQMEEFSAENLLLISGTKETLSHIRGVAEAFIVSTSYEHYIRALCKAIDFPFKNTYCTRLCIDKYTLSAEEKTKLRSLAKEIADMPMITIPDGAKSVREFSAQDQALVKRLDEIFWKKIADMPCGRIFGEVKTIGGEEKAQAIRDATQKLGLPLSSVMYVGDSITDVQAFQLVKANGGFALSFNGNGYAVKNAQAAAMSENNVVTAVFADVFLNLGTEKALQLAQNWSQENIKTAPVTPQLLERLFTLYPTALPKVEIVTPKNMEALSKESSSFRKIVRGEAVGKLG
jgi:energy-converting hydrogenase A subunit R